MVRLLTLYWCFASVQSTLCVGAPNDAVVAHDAPTDVGILHDELTYTGNPHSGSNLASHESDEENVKLSHSSENEQQNVRQCGFLRQQLTRIFTSHGSQCQHISKSPEHEGTDTLDDAILTRYLMSGASAVLETLFNNAEAMVPFSWESWPLDHIFSKPRSRVQTRYKVQKPPLDTDWTYKVGTDPWPEHPRPQLKRDAWQSLNGIWTWRADAGPGGVHTPPRSGPLEREVLVPACIESGLSGLQELDIDAMWYRTTFEVPKDWSGQHVLLNFESVDYEATIFVNGKKTATHKGGYNRFTVDVTRAVKFGKKNELLVFVYDPTDSADIPVGKQTRHPSHIFYRKCSGIWQQVWIESAPSDHVTQLDVAAGADGKVNVNVHSSKNANTPVEVIVWGQNDTEIARHYATADEEFSFEVSSPQLWWPETPTLYNLTVVLGAENKTKDEVSSYTGFRTVSRGKVNGVTRPLLNGQFVFQFGTLDQGFWPDGLYTPPSREAMVYDLRVLKRFGFNMVRKHVKIEPDLFYHACDQLGLMVLQDMPSLPANGMVPNDNEQAEFKRQLEIMVNQHKSYPSIVTWVIYNEGWGQRGSNPPPEADLTRTIRRLDPSRLINSVTGWSDHGYGDYVDNHNYAQPQCGTPYYSTPKAPYDHARIGIAGEYGGIGHNVSIDHLWNVKQAIDGIPQTYEIHENLQSYNYRSMTLMRDIREQTEQFACSGAVYTQTTDVEGEVNGLLTYDRRVLRPNVKQWQDDIHRIYYAAYKRGGKKPPAGGSLGDMQY